MKKLLITFILIIPFCLVTQGQTASESYDYSRNDTLIQKVEIMMWKVCQAVIGEADVANGGTYPSAVIAKRHSLAIKCFNDSDEYKRRFTSAIFSLGLFDATISDINIEGYIGNVFNDLAGVTYNDLNP